MSKTGMSHCLFSVGQPHTFFMELKHPPDQTSSQFVVTTKDEPPETAQQSLWQWHPSLQSEKCKSRARQQFISNRLDHPAFGLKNLLPTLIPRNLECKTFLLWTSRTTRESVCPSQQRLTATLFGPLLTPLKANSNADIRGSVAVWLSSRSLGK